MAAHERLAAKASIASPTLLQKLATVLPKDANFKIYHLSTLQRELLRSIPRLLDRDLIEPYCENHFLAVSITVAAETPATEAKEVLVFAVEIFIYSTAYDTTFFVSKADSTGYLHLLGLPKGTPSPIRDISATFLQHLVETHRRPNLRSVISLFARAQDQYLFPGSIENSGKHVLDDRGLVRWWCRVLDPLIEESKSSGWESVKGYLVVPGLETYETSSYIPKRSIPNKSWAMGHPLVELSRHPDEVPPRCLIPHFPDDPKSRFLDELDEEISRGKDNSTGQWKSVKTIDQFWEMMAFRQECSAGRMVGFIWIVFTPLIQRQVEVDSQNTTRVSDKGSVQPKPAMLYPATPATSFNATICSTQVEITAKEKKLSGPIIPRQPRIKTENKNYLLERPESTAYYFWCPEGRGQIIVDESDYKRVTELLLRLDFANLDLATSSSTRWINEVRSGAWGSMRDAWGKAVTGMKAVDVRTQASATGVQTLNLGLVRKKRKPEVEEVKSMPDPTPQVNILTTGMIRKKPKV